MTSWSPCHSVHHSTTQHGRLPTGVRWSVAAVRQQVDVSLSDGRMRPSDMPESRSDVGHGWRLSRRDNGHAGATHELARTFRPEPDIQAQLEALFDPEYYLDQNRDVALASLHPFQHYLTYGAVEGRSPNPLFDAQFYLQSNPSVAAAE